METKFSALLLLLFSIFATVHCGNSPALVAQIIGKCAAGGVSSNPANVDSNNPLKCSSKLKSCHCDKVGCTYTKQGPQSNKLQVYTSKGLDKDGNCRLEDGNKSIYKLMNNTMRDSKEIPEACMRCTCLWGKKSPNCIRKGLDLCTNLGLRVRPVHPPPDSTRNATSCTHLVGNRLWVVGALTSESSTCRKEYLGKIFLRIVPDAFRKEQNVCEHCDCFSTQNPGTEADCRKVEAVICETFGLNLSIPLPPPRPKIQQQVLGPSLFEEIMNIAPLKGPRPGISSMPGTGLWSALTNSNRPEKTPKENGVISNEIEQMGKEPFKPVALRPPAIFQKLHHSKISKESLWIPPVKSSSELETGQKTIHNNQKHKQLVDSRQEKKQPPFRQRPNSMNSIQMSTGMKYRPRRPGKLMERLDNQQMLSRFRSRPNIVEHETMHQPQLPPWERGDSFIDPQRYFFYPQQTIGGSNKRTRQGVERYPPMDSSYLSPHHKYGFNVVTCFRGRGCYPAKVFTI